MVRHEKQIYLFYPALIFHYLYTVCENRMRFGIVKSEMQFPLAFALSFRYICLTGGNRLRFGTTE